MSNILTAIITAIVTALLATVIFVLVQIALCKCHPKTSVEKEEPTVYEQMDGVAANLAMSDPAYMEIGEGEKGNALELKRNEAYGTGFVEVKRNEAYSAGFAVEQAQSTP